MQIPFGKNNLLNLGINQLDYFKGNVKFAGVMFKMEVRLLVPQLP